MKKMNNVRVLLAMTALFAAVGCSTKQDPLADQSDKIRTASPATPPDQKPAPIDSKNLVLDAPNFLTVIEGNQTSFEIRTRVMIPGYDRVSAVIEDLANVTGASYDLNTQVFKWMPELGFTGAEATRQVILKVKAIATSSSDALKPPLMRSSEITIQVQKLLQTPVIAKVDGLPSSLRERDNVRFSVFVDLGTSSTLDAPPALEILTVEDKEELSLAPFLEIDRPVYQSNLKQWKFVVTLDLRQELTDSYADGSFRIRALSSFGKVSNDFTYRGIVKNFLTAPISNMISDIDLKPGIEAKYTFVVYDRKGEAVLSLGKLGLTLPERATLKCESGHSETDPLTCTFTYTPTGIVGQGRKGRVVYYIKSASKRPYQDSAELLTQFGFDFTVEPLPFRSTP